MKVLLATTATPDDRKTVACARALAGSGFSVAVGGDSFWGQSFYSRCVHRRVRYPHPRFGIPPFLEAINEHIERDRIDVVLPMNDYTTIALTRSRESLHPGAATALPSAESLETAGDKARTMVLANRLGLATPRSFCAQNRDQLPAMAESIGFPCVLKPRRSSGAVGFQRIENRRQLISACQTPPVRSDIAFDFEHVLVQEYVSGEVHDACLLCDRGEMKAGLTQKRLRTYPGDAGVGTLIETTYEPQLLRHAERLCKALSWHGPAQVEFKVEPETGRIWLIEINGRFWGTTDVAVQAGVDFPRLTCRLALGAEVKPAFDYTVGLRYRYPFPFGLLAMTDGAARWRAAREFFGPRAGVRSDVDWSDPLPLLAEAVYIGRRAWKRKSLRPERDRRGPETSTCPAI